MVSQAQEQNIKKRSKKYKFELWLFVTLPIKYTSSFQDVNLPRCVEINTTPLEPLPPPVSLRPVPLVVICSLPVATYGTETFLTWLLVYPKPVITLQTKQPEWRLDYENG